MSTSNVKVTVVAHPTTNLVITPSTKNPEWGTFRVDSKNVSMENGILNINSRSAFVRGKLEDLAQLSLSAGQVLPGKIVKRESFDPFYENQPSKINPTTKEVVLTNGKPTYLEFVYSADPDALDVWVGDTPATLAAKAAKELEAQTTGN